MISAATAPKLSEVALNMREADFEEFCALYPVSGRVELAAAVAARYADREDVVVFEHQGSPIAIGGAIEARPNVITLLFCATDAFPSILLSVARFLRRELFPRFREVGVHRIECVTLAGRRDTQDLLRALGLKYEAECKGYGKNGESFAQWAWVHPSCT